MAWRSLSCVSVRKQDKPALVVFGISRRLKPGFVPGVNSRHSATNQVALKVPVNLGSERWSFQDSTFLINSSRVIDIHLLGLIVAFQLIPILVSKLNNLFEVVTPQYLISCFLRN